MALREAFLFVWWFYLLVVLAVALALLFYSRSRRSPRASYRRRLSSETSSEIGAPIEAIDPEKAFLSDRLSGVSRPLASPPDEQGSLSRRPLRKDSLSKEVELDWEASDIIEFPKGAYAYPRDFRDEEEYVLPSRYGADKLVLMARDPRWIYAYWEVAHERHRLLFEQYVSEWSSSRPALRFYDLSETAPGRGYFDVILNEEADNWYVRVDRPDHRLVAELGRLFPGRFVSLVRSNEVTMPRDSVSSEISEEWAPIGWESRYGKYVAQGSVSSPLKWRK